MNALTRLLDASREAYLQQREAARQRRRACAPGEAPQRTRKARRPPLVSMPGHPGPTVYAPMPEPLAVSPAPTVEPDIIDRDLDQERAIKRLIAAHKPRRSGADFTMSTHGKIDVLQQIKCLTESGNTLTYNEDGQVSSPELTAWYVSRIIQCNPYA